MSPQSEIERLLRENKAELVRQKKHQVWRFPNGKQIVWASTPSDVRADRNKLRDLRNLLGLVDHDSKLGPNPPRERKTVRVRSEPRKVYSLQPVPVRPTLRARLESLKATLPKTRSLEAPLKRDCCPMWVETIPQTFVTTLLRRIFR